MKINLHQPESDLWQLLTYNSIKLPLTHAISVDNDPFRPLLSVAVELLQQLLYHPLEVLQQHSCLDHTASTADRTGESTSMHDLQASCKAKLLWCMVLDKHIILSLLDKQNHSWSCMCSILHMSSHVMQFCLATVWGGDQQYVVCR